MYAKYNVYTMALTIFSVAKCNFSTWLELRCHKQQSPLGENCATKDRSEGDINLGGARAAWQRDYIDAETRALLEEDSRWFLHQALELCWTQPIGRLLVNTCTLDHKKALATYQRAGFEPYSRAERYVLVPHDFPLPARFR